ncbi:MAG: hypothetical protein H7Y31_11610 [Chitinophagaceae bacterium]|nr:hypothetical protein [Chitinophagaceae bacterium]
MQKLKKLSVLFFAFLLLGCYEVNEEIVINENGSGTFVTRMDMSQLLEMMQGMGGEEMAKEGLDRPIDTVFMMKSFVDSAKEITAEQKQLLANGKMRMQMNMDKKVFKIDTDFPFANYGQLQQLLAGTGGMSALGGVMKKVFGKDGEENNQPDSPKDPGMGEMADIFDATVNNGTISKKVNKAKFDALMSKPESDQMKQLGTSGIEILYTTVIRLPRPVKSSDNPLIKLSDDKKTLTIKYNYLEVFENPEKFNYTITY